MILLALSRPPSTTTEPFSKTYCWSATLNWHMSFSRTSFATAVRHVTAPEVFRLVAVFRTTRKRAPGYSSASQRIFSSAALDLPVPAGPLISTSGSEQPSRARAAPRGLYVCSMTGIQFLCLRPARQCLHHLAGGLVAPAIPSPGG